MSSITVNIKRLDPTVELPKYAHPTDAGLDLRSSRAENSGFAGRTLTGRATDVFVGGKQTLADGCIC